MSGQAADQSDGRRRIREAVMDGAALSRFKAMMEAQGVAKKVAAALCSTHSDYYRVLRRAEHQMELSSPADGKEKHIETLQMIHFFSTAPHVLPECCYYQ